MTIFFAVLHIPTQRLFPIMKTGSTHYDFYYPPRRTKHKNEKPPPRLFESRRMAQRYITEYCKGIRNNDYFVLGEAVKYEMPSRPRNPADFEVVEVSLSIKSKNFRIQVSNVKLKETVSEKDG